MNRGSARTLIIGLVAIHSALCGCDDQERGPAPVGSPVGQTGAAGDQAAQSGDVKSDAVGFSAGLEAAIERGIMPPTSDDATYRIDPFVAALVFEALRVSEGQGVFMLTAADLPRPAGYLVQTIAPDSAWARLGLQSDDVIETINGVHLSEPAALGRALDGAENQVVLSVFREDFLFTVSYRLDGGLAWRSVLSESLDAEDAPEPEPEPEPGDSIEVEADADAQAPPQGSNAPAKGRGGGTAKKPTVPRTKSRPKPVPSRPTSPPAGSGDIECASSTRCSITKARFDALVASPQKLQSQVDIVPAIRNDVHSGYKLKRVAVGSPVHRLGFRTGDKITHINGRFLGDDAQAMALYWSLGSSRLFKVRYERAGRKRVKTVTVR